jgi:hypothetical protein
MSLRDVKNDAEPIRTILVMLAHMGMALIPRRPRNGGGSRLRPPSSFCPLTGFPPERTGGRPFLLLSASKNLSINRSFLPAWFLKGVPRFLQGPVPPELLCRGIWTRTYQGMFTFRLPENWEQLGQQFVGRDCAICPIQDQKTFQTVP